MALSKSLMADHYRAADDPEHGECCGNCMHLHLVDTSSSYDHSARWGWGCHPYATEHHFCRIHAPDNTFWNDESRISAKKICNRYEPEPLLIEKRQNCAHFNPMSEFCALKCSQTVTDGDIAVTKPDGTPLVIPKGTTILYDGLCTASDPGACPDFAPKSAQPTNQG